MFYRRFGGVARSAPARPQQTVVAGNTAFQMAMGGGLNVVLKVMRLLRHQQSLCCVEHQPPVEGRRSRRACPDRVITITSAVQ